MKDDVIRAQLLANNPFFSGSAADPWENRAPDVSSLNQNAHEGICALINAKCVQPWEPMAGLVMGEAGEGKTHLLKRILAYTRENNISITFASIRPFLNSETPMQHLLREIVVNLTRVERSAADASGTERRRQFEYLISQLMCRYQKKSGNPGFALEKVITFFRANIPDIVPDVLRALFHYRDPVMSTSVLDWLGGEVVDEKVAATLGVSNRWGGSNSSLEAEAARIIRSLGQLLDFCGMSMLVCFDQLDGLREEKTIRAFGGVLHFLVNEVPAMLPIAFIRTRTLDEVFAPYLDQAVRQRLDGNRFRLRGCTPDQARELIRLRLNAFFREDSEEKYRWLLGRLEGRLQMGYAPRRVIELANRVILNVEETVSPVPDPKNFFAIFTKEYRQAKDEVAADFDMWPPDADRLRYVLEVWLKSRSEFEDLKRGNDKYVALMGKCTETNRHVDCAFVINTAGHHKTAEAAFKRGIEFLQQHKGRCWYITDGRCSFPDSWKVAHQLKKEFEALGGRVLILDRQRAVEWYGLTSLIFKLRNGDVSLPDAANVLRPAGEQDFAAFMEKGFATDLLAASAVSPGVPPPPAELPMQNEAALETKTTVLLKKSPMRLEKATLLLGELTKQGESLSYEVFLEFVNRRRELFALHPSSDGSLVQLLR